MTAAKKKPAAKKTAAKKKAVRTPVTTPVTPEVTSVAPKTVGEMVPARNGGMIWRGPALNHVAGSGRPKDEVRAAFLGVSAKGAQFLNELMDGVVKVDFVGVCPHCSETSEPPVPAALVKSLLASLNASMDGRLRATDLSARYGLSAKELVIASPQAKAFFDCVHAAIVELAGEDVAAQVQTRAVALMDEARS